MVLVFCFVEGFAGFLQEAVSRGLAGLLNFDTALFVYDQGLVVGTLYSGSDQYVYILYSNVLCIFHVCYIGFNEILPLYVTALLRGCRDELVGRRSTATLIDSFRSFAKAITVMQLQR